MSKASITQRNHYKAAVWGKYVVDALVTKEGLLRNEGEAILTFLYEPHSVYPKDTLLAFKALTAYAEARNINVREAQTILESHIPL